MSSGMHYGASRKIFQMADSLRKNMTEAGKALWKRICKNKLNVRFRCQHPISTFIADFYCHDLKLVIEIDGGIHLASGNKEYDISRTEMIEAFGIKVVRFTNEEVLNNIEKVIDQINKEIEIINMEIMKWVLNV